MSTAILARETRTDRYINLSFLLTATEDTDTIIQALEATDGIDDVRAGRLEEIVHVDCRYDREGRGTGPATMACGTLIGEILGCEILAGGMGKLGRTRAEEWVGARPVDGPGGDFH